MKEKINVNAYAETITNALKSGILLNTNGKKFNTMVIGWGGLGICWGRQVFTVYVREGRFTREQLDSTREFTLSVPLDAGNPEIVKICGWQSGRDIDKVQYAHLTLELPGKNSTPAIREYPLTLECKVLYSQKQELTGIPEEIVKRSYPQDVDGSYPMANRDAHIAYIGEIVSAYIIMT